MTKFILLATAYKPLTQHLMAPGACWQFVQKGFDATLSHTRPQGQARHHVSHLCHSSGAPGSTSTFPLLVSCPPVQPCSSTEQTPPDSPLPPPHTFYNRLPKFRGLCGDLFMEASGLHSTRKQNRHGLAGGTERCKRRFSRYGLWRRKPGFGSAGNDSGRWVEATATRQHECASHRWTGRRVMVTMLNFT